MCLGKREEETKNGTTAFPVYQNSEIDERDKSSGLNEVLSTYFFLPLLLHDRLGNF